MKIAIVTDTHFGARNDSPIFLKYFCRFFDEVFFPAIDARKIDTVFHLGDLMDRRKFVNFATLTATRKHFVEPLKDRGIFTFIIPGNHDTYFRNTNDVNCIQELFRDDMELIDSPTTMEFDGLGISFLPWINEENEEETLRFVSKCKSPILMGHLELKGFEVLRGVEAHEGMDHSLFEKFDAVYSGHYHCKHSKGNIHYLGTPYQITFADLYEPKGFHILDTKTRKVEYIKNPATMFNYIVYDDTKHDYLDEMPDFSAYEDTFVRVMVRNKTNPLMFDRFVESLTANRVFSVNLLQDKDMGFDSEEGEEESDITADTLSIINAEIDAMKIDNPAKLKTIMRELYTESLQS
jgi:DNA repair exonuclease SbcCD nuclease subunit